MTRLSPKDDYATLLPAATNAQAKIKIGSAHR